MGASSNKSPKIEVESITELLAQHDSGMRELFAKALNLYVAPGMEGVPSKERLDRLRQAVDQPVNDARL